MTQAFPPDLKESREPPLAPDSQPDAGPVSQTHQVQERAHAPEHADRPEHGASYLAEAEHVRGIKKDADRGTHAEQQAGAQDAHGFHHLLSRVRLARNA